MDTYANIGTIRNEQDDIFCLLLGFFGLNNVIFDRVRFLGTILHLDFVLPRFIKLNLSPRASSHSNINRLIGIVENSSVLGFNGVNPFKSPIFNLGMLLKMEVAVDIVPFTISFADNSLKILVRSRRRFGCVLVISMKFYSQVKETSRNKR